MEGYTWALYVVNDIVTLPIHSSSNTTQYEATQHCWFRRKALVVSFLSLNTYQHYNFDDTDTKNYYNYNYISTISDNINNHNFTIASDNVPKRHREEWLIFASWVQRITNANTDWDHLQQEWLHLVYDLRYQDEYNRRAQATVVISIALGDEDGTDVKSVGRLLNSRDLAGTRIVRASKGARKLATKQVEGVLVDDVDEKTHEHVDSEQENAADFGAPTGDRSDDDDMVIDGPGGFDDGAENEHDDMEIDGGDSFNDSGIPPSSPLAGPKA